MAEDQAKATAEYMAEFRADLEQFVSREAVMASASMNDFPARRKLRGRSPTY
jgi:hypothetical protein